MKIDTAQQNYMAALDSTLHEPATKHTDESRQRPQPGNAAYSVHLSAQAHQAAEPDKVGEEDRRAKIAAIKDQLASGAYSISGKDVATKILTLLKG